MWQRHVENSSKSQLKISMRVRATMMGVRMNMLAKMRIIRTGQAGNLIIADLPLAVGAFWSDW